MHSECEAKSRGTVKKKKKKVSLENIDSMLVPEKKACISISFFLFNGTEGTILSI